MKKLLVFFVTVLLLIVICIYVGKLIVQEKVTNQDLVVKASEYCGEKVSVSVCNEEIILISSSLPGGGMTYIKNGEEISCPPVSPNLIKKECETIRKSISNCKQVPCPD